MVQPPKDTPFGLEQNVAAGLAYLLGIIGGIIMLVGGGTNKFVKWAACQSITYFVCVFLLYWVLGWLFVFVGYSMAGLILPLFWIVRLAIFIGWIWLFVTAFQGKEVRVPIIANLTESVFKGALS
jgi:uncharacterized membrane protein